MGSIFEEVKIWIDKCEDLMANSTYGRRLAL